MHTYMNTLGNDKYAQMASDDGRFFESPETVETTIVFLTVSPKPYLKANLNCEQQYRLQIPPLMKILKEFDFEGSVEFTTLNCYIHIHCIIPISNDKIRFKWLKAIPKFKEIGNTNIKLVKNNEKDIQRVKKYIYKDIEMTKNLLNLNYDNNKEYTTYYPVVLNKATSNDFHKVIKSQVDLEPLNKGIKKITISKKSNEKK